jgi:predicted glycosyltransferase
VRGKALKIAIYSHDAMGLGHMRRNLLISEALGQVDCPPHVLLIAGAPELGAFTLPSHVDAVMLPPFVKTAGRGYVPRTPFDSTKSLLAMRAGIIRATLDLFLPDVVITDKLPRGLMGELDAAIDDLSGHTRFVLGLRDILDHPLAVHRDWLADGNEAAIRESYEAVWVYGDPSVYDPRYEYGLSHDVSNKLRFTGYLDPSPRLKGNGQELPHEDRLPARFTLCLVGGGQDGGPLARGFARAVLDAPGRHGLVITGPFMPAETKAELCSLARGQNRLRVREFVRHPGRLLRRAERVVTMCGYNALTEAVTLGVPILGVPRVKPRIEQLIRAQRFADLGLIDVMYPDDASPDAIGNWLENDVPPPPRADQCIDFKGLERLPEFVEDIIPGRLSYQQKPAREVP